jgi:hypothetical protein
MRNAMNQLKVLSVRMCNFGDSYLEGVTYEYMNQSLQVVTRLGSQINPAVD